MPERVVTAVISQPMYFPWCGIFQQMQQADIWIHYDDAQFARGFFNRVQIRGVANETLLTVPLRRHSQRSSIRECVPSDEVDWRANHLKALRHAYAKTPFFDRMFEVAQRVLRATQTSLADLSIASTESIARDLGLMENLRIVRSSDLGGSERASRRLIEICQRVGANRYLTGHGARGYLDHEAFEEVGIDVDYVDYVERPYEHVSGASRMQVTMLDGIAHLGGAAVGLARGASVGWREFLKRT